MPALVVGRSVVGRALGQRRLPSRLGEADDDPGSDNRSFFLVLRYAQVDGEVTFGKSGLLLDKWDLGVGRIINFTAVSILATRFRSVLRFLAIKPLVMLGQSSLPVFCVHLLCVFCALTIMGNDPILRDWKGIVVIPTSLSALLLTRQNCHQPTGKRREKSSCGPRSVRLHARAVTNRGSQRIRWFERLLKIRTTSSSDNVQSQAAFSS
jgi:OpgC protein